jgi:hypothetical protein
MAVSVVMRAIDGSIEHPTADPDLFERTVELSLRQLPSESTARWDGESSAFDVVLYGQSRAAKFPAFQSLNDVSGNPILLLDSASRVAFFLHHVLGYTIHQAAVKAQVSEKEYRKELRKAYLPLASCQLDHESPSSHEVGESA